MVSMLVLGSRGLNLEFENGPTLGMTFGFLASLIALRVRNRCIAGLVVSLVIAAAILAGPMVGFMLLFGLFTGFGGLFALAGTWGEPGMEGVGIHSIALLGIAAAAALCFVSQAWAVLRARDVWRQHR
ncbi:hypothetical protein ABFT80_10585 [Mesorhizobium sp. SB112]|uniref:hypothetical protein n=1 Tax=Mesorhizobium sp. SB112 TaxID=3151853 RepID=UPI003266D250